MCGSISGAIPTTQTCYLLASTNIAAPTAQWVCLATNVVTAGQFRFTNAIDLSVQQMFYRVQLP